MSLFTFMSRIWNKILFSLTFRIWRFKIKETKNCETVKNILPQIIHMNHF